ncbi:MFS transporter [Pedobacter sp. HMF7647]|uniref:MFS transporter n=1 Tax=Hufsiella arboris TaxID=2695275 RepID=A0A7K1Y9Y6_9SPHI|nr:MFS transporter [Hufsiella arboris]MXV51382.1 MFS transporter [Hufsiella arboris]
MNAESTLAVSLPKISNRAHRIGVGVLFFFMGLTFSSWASRIPTIQQTLQLNEAELGALLLMLPAGLLVSAPIAGLLIAKFGSRRVVVASLTIYTFLLFTIGLIHNVTLLSFVLFCFGFTSNLTNISVNKQAVDVENMYGRPILASFHGLWSLAGFVGAAIGAVMISNDISIPIHYSVILTLVVIGVISSVRFLINDDNEHKKSDDPLFTMPDKSLLILSLIALCSLICEGAMFDWSSVYFKKVVMPDPSMLGAGYVAFMATMATGRFLADGFSHRFGLKTTLMLSGTLTVIGLLTAVIFPHLITAIIGFMLVGFGVSSVVPLSYSLAAKSKTMKPGVAIAAITTIGFMGFLIGPPLIGFVAQAASLRASFTIIAFMGLCVLIFSSRLKTTK